MNSIGINKYFDDQTSKAIWSTGEGDNRVTLWRAADGKQAIETNGDPILDSDPEWWTALRELGVPVGVVSEAVIHLDPDPSCWGSECDPETASIANERLAELLRADGYEVEIGLGTTSGARNSDEDDEIAALIYRHGQTALQYAIAHQS